MVSLVALFTRRAHNSAQDVSRCCDDGEVGWNFERSHLLPRRVWRDAVVVTFCGSDSAISESDVLISLSIKVVLFCSG